MMRFCKNVKRGRSVGRDKSYRQFKLICDLRSQSKFSHDQTWTKIGHGKTRTTFSHDQNYTKSGRDQN